MTSQSIDVMSVLLEKLPNAIDVMLASLTESLRQVATIASKRIPSLRQAAGAALFAVMDQVLPAWLVDIASLVCKYSPLQYPMKWILGYFVCYHILPLIANKVRGNYYRGYYSSHNA